MNDQQVLSRIKEIVDCMKRHIQNAKDEIAKEHKHDYDGKVVMGMYEYNDVIDEYEVSMDSINKLIEELKRQ